MARLGSAIALAVMVVAQTGCFSQKKADPASAPSSEKKGQIGVYFYVNLPRPPVGGIVASSESPTPRIRCGASTLGTPKADANGVLQYDPAYYAGATSCGDATGQTQYQWSESVVLTATAQAGFTFFGWAGDCSGTGSCTLSAGADKTVVAVFTSGNVWFLTVAKVGSGTGTVTADIPGQQPISCGPGVSLCNFAVPATNPPTVAVLAGTPDATSHFVGWSGACSGPGACEVAVGTLTELTASFDANPAGSTVVGGAGGVVDSPTGVTITVPPAAIDTPSGFAVTLATAPPPLPTDVQPISPIYQFEPAGQVFAAPVTIRLPVPPGTTSACIWWEDRFAAAYECVGGTVTNGFIEAQVSHFSAAFVGPVPTTHTIQGTRFNTYLATLATVTNLPVNLAGENVAAWVSDGSGGYARIAGQGFADGTFRVQNVPNGVAVLVQVGSSFTAISASASTTATNLDLGQVVDGLPGLVDLAPTDPMPMALQIQNLAPYQAGDEVDVFSPRSDTWALGVEGFGFPTGSTTLAVTNLRAARQPLNPMSAIDGTRAATLVTQLQGADAPGGNRYLRLARFGKILGLTVSPTTPPVPTSVTLQEFTQGNMVTLDWNLAAYRDAIRQAGASTCTTGGAAFYVLGQPGSILFGMSPIERKRTYLATSFSIATPSVSTGPMTFALSGSPQEAWSLMWRATTNCGTPVTLPTGATLTLNTAITTHGSYVEPSGGASLPAPVISPVRNVQLNGASLMAPRPNVPDGPVISWDPPLVGTPDLYTIVVRRHPGGGAAYQGEGTLYTADTRIAIPPGFLKKGEVYSVLLVADKGGGTPTRPARLNLPNSRANQMAGWFSISPDIVRVGGTVSSLRGTGLVLGMAGQPPLAVGPMTTGFTFANPVATGTPYAVTVVQQPSSPSQTCAVANGNGIAGTTDVTNVTVTCRTLQQPFDCADLVETGIGSNWSYTYTPGGSFSTTLSTLTTPAPYRGVRFVRAVTTAAFDFGFVFSGPEPIDASAYEQLRFAVRALNPNILVGGSPWQGNYPVVVLQDAAGSRQTFTPTTNLMPLDGTTWIPIAVPLAGGAGWTVTGGGNRSAIVKIEIHSDTWEWNQLTIDVDGLSFDHPGTICPATYSVGGLVDGLLGAGLVLRDNGGDDLPVAGSGPFAFGTRLVSGSEYAVTVAQQPVGQTCTVSNGSGVVGSSSVVSVNVSCRASVYPVGGTVSGLIGGSVVLSNAFGSSPAEDITVSANGSFAFAGLGAFGSVYSVTVKSQPAAPAQTCTVLRGAGVLNGPVSDVAVACRLAPPAIASFVAAPATIQPGQEATLSWVVTGATGLSIDQGVGAVAGATVRVSTTLTRTYSLTAANAGGVAVASATVTVATAPEERPGLVVPPSIGSPPTAVITPVIFVPRDRAYPTAAMLAAIEAAVQDVQVWYRTRLGNGMLRFGSIQRVDGSLTAAQYLASDAIWTSGPAEIEAALGFGPWTPGHLVMVLGVGLDGWAGGGGNGSAGQAVLGLDPLIDPAACAGAWWCDASTWRGTAIHELGHALTLVHSTLPSIMQFNGNPLAKTLLNTGAWPEANTIRSLPFFERTLGSGSPNWTACSADADCLTNRCGCNGSTSRTCLPTDDYPQYCTFSNWTPCNDDSECQTGICGCNGGTQRACLPSAAYPRYCTFPNWTACQQDSDCASVRCGCNGATEHVCLPSAAYPTFCTRPAYAECGSDQDCASGTCGCDGGTNLLCLPDASYTRTCSLWNAAPPPGNLRYAANPVVYQAGAAIAPNAPTSSGGPIASYSVSPALPAGLTLSPTTGVIYGTPIFGAAPATYVVTATNSGGSASATLSLTVEQNTGLQVDLDVTFIERTPRYAYDAAKNMPAPGDLVTFRGHVRNWSNFTASVDYRWEMDGAVVASGTLNNLYADADQVVELPWVWQDGPHDLKFTVDPLDRVAESSELNNSLSIRTNAIAVGLWVEQGLHAYFQTYQKALGIGSNSWEDWAQRNMARWNEYNVEAIHPTSPLGVTDRVFIDKITIVPDGALPLHGGLASNNPDTTDRTVDLAWGFPSSDLSGTGYVNHTTISDDNPFYFQWALIHELGHARYLIDLYGFDVHYSADASQVQILENGTPVAGSALMPFLAWNEVLHYNQFGGVMTGPWRGWSPYEAVALNLISGKRASQGNMNSPGNIGVFLNDLPQRNHVRFVDSAGQPLVNASVRLYQGTYGPGTYGKVIGTLPPIDYTTDASGEILLPRNPFTSGPVDVPRGVAVVRIESQGTIWYRFIEVPAFNLEYWRGHTQDGFVEIELPVPGSPPRIEIQGYEQVIPPGKAIATLADHTDFGSTSASNPYAVRTFVIKNRGGSNLALTGSKVGITGPDALDFQVRYPPSVLPGEVVSPGSLSTFQIRFAPRNVGTSHATVTITSSDPATPSWSFAIQGTATP